MATSPLTRSARASVIPAAETKRRAGSRPRIQDVAAQTGVSLGTVSAVLNGNGRISTETRERVQQAIQRLGYRPDFYASNLARRDTKLLGLVVSSLQNPFFAETAQAIEQEAMRLGFQLSLMTTNFSRAQQRAVLEQLLQARIAGLAVMTSEHDEVSRQIVLDSGVPAVFLDMRKPEANMSTIRVDSRSGMRAAVEHLLALGHRKLLYVRNSQQSDFRPLRSHRLRDEGFAAAVRASDVRDLEVRVIDIPGLSAEAGERAIAKVYTEEFFSAVVAATDNVALGVYRGLQKRNLRIPTDVSVVGFDNIYFSRFLSPPLTTVDVHRGELSRLVLEALTGAEPAAVRTMATTLVVRESTLKPRPTHGSTTGVRTALRGAKSPVLLKDL